jgi:hypothetical protein
MYPAFCRNLAEYGILRAWFLPIISFLERPEMLWHHVAHPPLTHLGVALLFQLFGPSEAVYRLFNLLTGGLVMAVFLYLLARRWLGRRAALWALAFWAFIPSAAYFERMYSMSMQAYALGLALYYFFLRRVEEPKGGWGVPLYLVCLVGPLVDWQFDFAFGGLLLFCLVRRGPWRLWLRATALAAGVTLAYFAYSALVQTHPPLAGEPRTGTGLAYWISYALNRLNPLRVFSLAYFQRLGEMFALNFTVAGWLVPVLWVLGLWRGKGGFHWGLWLPLLCLVPGGAYLILVPHDTWGHVWTLYGTMSFLALAFGVGMDRLLAREGWWPRLVATGLAGLLFALAIPTLVLLHRPSSYLVGNVRLGKLVSEAADRSQYGLVENHDTLDFYAGLSNFDVVARPSLVRELEGWRRRLDKLPAIVALNQAYLPWRWPAPWGRQELTEQLSRDLAPFGYRLWLRRPFPVWSREPRSLPWFILDQFPPTQEGPLSPSTIVYFVDGPRLLRGFLQKVRGGQGTTVFRGLTLPARRCVLRAWVRLGEARQELDRTWRLSWLVEAKDEGGNVLRVTGRLTPDRPQAEVSLDLTPFAGKRVDLAFSWQAPPTPAPLHLFWGEPRLVDPVRPLRAEYRLPRNGYWFREGDMLWGSPSPVSLAQARHFWAEQIRRLWDDR